MADERSDLNTRCRVNQQRSDYMKVRQTSSVANNDKKAMTHDGANINDVNVISRKTAPNYVECYHQKEFLIEDLEIRESKSSERNNENKRHFVGFSRSSDVGDEARDLLNAVNFIDSDGIERSVTTAKNRLIRDFQKLQSNPPNGVLAAPIDSNVMKWHGVIFGKDGSVWEGGIFKLLLEFTDNYPFKAPAVHFVTKIFHPNIGPNGEISLNALGKNWTPAYDVADILTSLQSLLYNPEAEAVISSEANALFKQNRFEYNRRVREIVEESVVSESRRRI